MSNICKLKKNGPQEYSIRWLLACTKLKTRTDRWHFQQIQCNYGVHLYIIHCYGRSILPTRAWCYRCVHFIKHKHDISILHKTEGPINNDLNDLLKISVYEWDWNSGLSFSEEISVKWSSTSRRNGED